MRELDHQKKVQFDSLVEIRQGLAIEAERLADTGMKGGRIRTKPSHLLNWLSCWFLSLPVADRERIARAGKAILDRHRASDEPLTFEGNLVLLDELTGWAAKGGRGRVEVDSRSDDHVPGKRRSPKGG